MPEPWFKVKVGITRSDKLLSLPSDAARWGWLKVLAEAKMQRQLGVFGSRTQLVDLLGKHGRYVGDYLTLGLLHVAPGLCDQCRVRAADVKPGQLVVHDFRKEQRDPSNADRQASWYADHLSNADPNSEPNGDPNALSNADPNARPNGSLTGAGDDGDGESDGERISSKENRSPQPSRMAERERADVQALLDRGWRRVTAAQRRVLDEVLDRHDVTGATWAAGIIAETPTAADPLDAVLAADSAWQREQRDAADRVDAAWRATKAAERSGAGGSMAALEANAPMVRR